MQLGMIGLGRMGANMVLRLLKEGHECIVYDRDQESVKALVAEGAIGAAHLADFASKLSAPRNAWIMVPAAVVDKVIDDLLPHLEPDDTIIDGGNSNYKDDIAHAKRLKPAGIHFVDCGASGGVFGLERGYCLMIGGEDSAVQRPDPVFAALAPGAGEIERTRGRSGDHSPDSFAVVGLDRLDIDDAAYRNTMAKEVRGHLGGAFDQDAWDRLSERIHYMTGNIKEEATYERLRELLSQLDAQQDTEGNHLFYLAVPPSLFGDITELLGRVGLVQAPREFPNYAAGT